MLAAGSAALALLTNDALRGTMTDIGPGARWEAVYAGDRGVVCCMQRRSRSLLSNFNSQILVGLISLDKHLSKQTW